MVDALLNALRTAAGPAAVSDDDAARAAAAADLHQRGRTPLAVVQPASTEAVSAVVAAAAQHGCAVLPRGGGLSYTGGYVSAHARSVLLDLAALNRVIAIAPEDMTITVEAGVTWRQIDAALAPLGLRLPFFGTFSGAGATVGGGLSHGALFFGSARYGGASDNVLGLDVVLADGSQLRTGQGALRVGSKPFLRSFGPDLTGLFTHDGGAFGIKTAASFRLIQRPAAYAYGSAAFASLEAAASALSAVAREDLAEEVYLLDPAVTAAVPAGLRTQLPIARDVLREGGWQGLPGAVADLVRGAGGALPQGCFSLHWVCAGRDQGSVAGDQRRARQRIAAAGGRLLPGLIPRVTRATVFSNLNGVLGADGARWAALNAKIAHSDAQALICAFDATMQPFAKDMQRHQVRLTRLASALGNHSFSFEPVFHWYDQWLPRHRSAPEATHLAGLQEPPANPEASALVDTLRSETVALFQRLGAASNQIGRCYPFQPALSDAPRALLQAIKDQLDPHGVMNPGVLGFPVPNKTPSP